MKKVMKNKFPIIRAIMLVLVFVMLLGTVSVLAGNKKINKVTSKKKLLEAIEKTDIGDITFKTGKEKKISIPKRENAENKKLIIEAPKSTISNKAKFSAIAINSVKSFTENASGNDITIKGKDARITVSKGKKVGSLVFSTKKADLILKAKTIVQEMQCKKKSAVISVDAGEKASADIVLANKTSLTVSGEKSADIKITNLAKGSTVTVSIPVRIIAKKDMKVNLISGAEGTVIERTSEDIKVEVTGTIKPEMIINADKEQSDQKDKSEGIGNKQEDNGSIGISGSDNMSTKENSENISQNGADSDSAKIGDIYKSYNVFMDYNNNYVNVCDHSYLYEYKGHFYRAETWHDADVIKLYVEEYSKEWELVSNKTITFEKPIMSGGLFAGEKYNFVVIGQENKTEDDNKMVVRILRYDKEWNKCGSVDVCGANTTVPFKSGDVMFAEQGDQLIIHTAHEGYTSADGLNHQSNMLISVNVEKMKITYAGFDFQPGYVSHSFNQDVIVDTEGRVVTLDRGDSYPRGNVVHILGFDNTWTTVEEETEYLIQEFAQYRDESTLVRTGSEIGGFAETEKGYVIAYNYDEIGGQGDGESNWTRNLYIAFLSKTDEEIVGRVRGTKVKYKGDGSMTAGEPRIASMGTQNGGYVFWEEGTVSDMLKTKDIGERTVNYVRYYADGSISEIHSFKGNLSACKMIYNSGKIYWYVTYNSVPKFYIFDTEKNEVSSKYVCGGKETVLETKLSSRPVEKYVSELNLLPDEERDLSTDRIVGIRYLTTDGELHSVLDYDYDNAGNIAGGTYRIVADTDDQYPEYHFKYSTGTNGRYISENIYVDADGVCIERHYDEKGNILYRKEWWYEADIETEFVEEDKYDANGVLIEERDSWADPSGSSESHCFYENGVLKKSIHTEVKIEDGDEVKIVEYREFEGDKVVNYNKEVFGDEV